MKPISSASDVNPIIYSFLLFNASAPPATVSRTSEIGYIHHIPAYTTQARLVGGKEDGEVSQVFVLVVNQTSERSSRLVKHKHILASIDVKSK